jgi:DNA polymerase-3 subunit epsilon
MLDRPLILLDLETTGAASQIDRITEIGLVEIDRAGVVAEWSSLVNPGRSIPADIQDLTGITDDMVSGAPAFSELASELHRRLEGKLLIAHNARFDYGFLSREFHRAGYSYRPDVLCTVRLSRKLFPQHARHNLDSLIERHGLSCENRHRALGDAKVLWDFLRTVWADPGPQRVQQAVAELLRKPALPPALPKDALDDLPEAPGAYVFYGADETPLYAGSTLNLLGRVLSHFSGDSRSARDRRIATETTRIEWQQAAGELGALLRRKQLVNRLRPELNRRSAAMPDPCSFAWDPVDGPKLPTVVRAGEYSDSGKHTLYGMFRSRRVALNALRELADAHGLCHIALGLEQGKGPCLGHRLGTCRGACIGKEPLLAHATRVLQALQPLRLPPWPFPGRVALREYDSLASRSEIHVFDRWRHLGSVDSAADLAEVLAGAGDVPFDIDTCKLLRRYLGNPPRSLEIRPLPATPGE